MLGIYNMTARHTALRAAYVILFILLPLSFYCLADVTFRSGKSVFIVSRFCWVMGFLTAAMAVIFIERRHPVLTRQRFSFLSVAAMMLATIYSTLLTMTVYGAIGFSGSQGFPFRWYWWTDLTTQYHPGQEYRWGALALDMVIWLFIVVAIGFGVEHGIRLLGKATRRFIWPNQLAAPNGGPTTPGANSRVTEGPPSVS
jgi:hypothetical protein